MRSIIHMVVLACIIFGPVAGLSYAQTAENKPNILVTFKSCGTGQFARA